MSGVEVIITVSDHNVVLIRDETDQKRKGRADTNPLRISTIQIFEKFIKTSRIEQNDELKVLGQHLYQTLFNEDVAVFFHDTLKRVPRGERLRVKLEFDESAANLAGLPWEYLWLPRKEAWLSTAADLVLSRFMMPLEGGRVESLDPAETKLRVLIVVSEPESLKPVIAAPVIEAIERLQERMPMDIRIHDAPTFDTFAEAVEESDPHVVHFMGHGRFNRAVDPGRAEIAFLRSATSKANEEWYADEDVAELFRQARVEPNLVFLHLCESGAVDFNFSFAGLAPQLIRKARVPAVVAMQYPIENKFAIQFSRVFYELLAKGEPVDSAVQQARYKLTNGATGKYTRVFGTPVLYMYARSGLIRPAGSTAAGGTPGKSGQGSTADLGRSGPAQEAVVPVRQSMGSGSHTDSVAASSLSQGGAPIVDAGSGFNPVGARLSDTGKTYRQAVREAERKARARLTEMNLDADTREEYSSGINTLRDALVSRPAEESSAILERHWDEAAGNMRVLIDVMITSIEEWKAAQAQEPHP